jgi:hypothetical protein
MALARVSTPINLSGLLASIPLNAGGGVRTTVADWWGRPTGSTPPPIHTQAPRFTVSLLTSSAPAGADPARLKFYGKLDKAHTHKMTVTQRASEGDGVSYYLMPGVYETNTQIDAESYREVLASDPDVAGNIANFLAPWEEGSPRVWVTVSQAIAQLNKLAEEEHCADILLAYDLTIGKLQRMLDAFVAAGGFPGDLRSAFGAESAWMSDPDRCQRKFVEVLTKTGKRDGDEWHSFRIAMAEAGEVGDLHEYPQVDSVGARFGKVFLKMEKSGTTRIGEVPSAHVITV